MFIQFFLVGSAIATGIVRLYKPRKPGIPVSLSREKGSKIWDAVDEHKESPSSDRKRFNENSSERDGVNRRFMLSFGVTGLSAIGRVVHPMFLFWSLPGLFYFNVYFIRRGYREIREKKRLGIASTIVVPIGTLNFMKIALLEGIVIRDSRALEALHSIDTVLFFNPDSANGILEYEFSQQNRASLFGSVSSSNAQSKKQFTRTIDAISKDSLLEKFAGQAHVKYHSVNECENLLVDLRQSGRSICMINADAPTLALMQDGDVSVVIGNVEGSQARLAQVYIPDGYIEQLIRPFDLGHAQHANFRASLWSIAVPSLLCLGGIYFLHFGVLTSIIADYLGLIAGIANAMLPGIKYDLQNGIKN